MVNGLGKGTKYGLPNTESAVSDRISGDYMGLRFQSSGRRIPKEKRARIFEQFYRLDSSRGSASGGAGLGLAIAKEIVALHGGGISAASADNLVTFTVTLPLQSAPAA